MIHLDYLNLSNNNLDGQIPEFICDINNYSLTDNYFCGSFLDCLDDEGIYPQINSSECDIYCNSSEESNLFGYCYNIEQTTEVNLSNQELEGNIPSEIGNLISLERLYLNNNQFSEIPSQISSLLNLERLQLQNNQLFGLIPESLCDLSIDFDSNSRFNITNNMLCPPYPSCVLENVGEQDTTQCSELSNEKFDLATFSLKSVYPNPFNPTTKIEYEISNVSNVNVSIYNTNGQLIDILVNKVHNPGEYAIVWNAQDYTSGVYIVKLIAGEYVDSQKMMLIK